MVEFDGYRIFPGEARCGSQRFRVGADVDALELRGGVIWAERAGFEAEYPIHRVDRYVRAEP